MKTLIYHSGALGDFIAFLPILSLWKNEHAETTIFCITHPAHGKLAHALGLIDTWSDVSSRTWMFMYMPDASIDTLTSYNFTHAILCTDPNGSPVRHCRAAGIPNIIAYAPFPDAQIQITQYHLKNIFPFVDLKTVNPLPCLKLTAPPRETQILSVSIHPGSGGNAKKWALEHYFKLTERFLQKGIPVSWIIGPSEAEIEIPEAVSVIYEQDLLLLAQAIGRTNVYIGNDSGISHLAGLTGIPCCILFGPSDPNVWQPCGNNILVIDAHAHIPAQTDRHRLRPCTCRCMQNISVDTVYEQCSILWNTVRPLNPPHSSATLRFA